MQSKVLPFGAFVILSLASFSVGKNLSESDQSVEEGTKAEPKTQIERDIENPDTLDASTELLSLKSHVEGYVEGNSALERVSSKLVPLKSNPVSSRQSNALVSRQLEAFYTQSTAL